LHCHTPHHSFHHTLHHPFHNLLIHSNTPLQVWIPYIVQNLHHDQPLLKTPKSRVSTCIRPHRKQRNNPKPVFVKDILAEGQVLVRQMLPFSSSSWACLLQDNWLPHVQSSHIHNTWCCNCLLRVPSSCISHISYLPSAPSLHLLFPLPSSFQTPEILHTLSVMSLLEIRAVEGRGSCYGTTGMFI
jgi:hypothetical protein